MTTYTIRQNFKLDDNGNERRDGWMVMQNDVAVEWLPTKAEAQRYVKESTVTLSVIGPCGK